MRMTILTLAMVLSLGLTTVTAFGEQVETFTEPYRRIAVPASEIGVIEKLDVQEGDSVVKDQFLGKLDDSVLRSSLMVADAAMKARGPQKSAEAEVEMRRQILEGYQSLSDHGNATKRELARSEIELRQAAARLQSTREEAELRHLEYERVKQQIEQRRILAPVAGIVIAIEKEAGEYVSPTDPVIMHIVQIDKLKAVFSVPRREAIGLKAGQKVRLSIGYEGQTCNGVIEFVSPIASPESNSNRVKVRIDNPKQEYQSGVSCRWNLDQSPAPETRETVKTTQVRSSSSTSSKR
ncbi:efflux RND transporter periplasmic adaptor subunit [Rubripirellula amarantea]|uniref:Macrolide export protein MacA n=1 Tax=Rubripirellula amarantea TaxID=2527999 RepID=A0A5C5WG35_9BACT|nr:efflux RND transporter periplasmic adaptor subunit [Rubripirellula amarantea]MDA8745981.1 efflux RND transporter periplasmic adaptor subunit [Rubripirellula amarantea]TWT49071.1 Macrolide export protein MacA [Rubripirellula amarantea]